MSPSSLPWLSLLALLASACEIDADSMGTPPVLAGSTGMTATTRTADASGDDLADSTGGGYTDGPRKRRLDLDPALLADPVGGSTLLVVLDATRIEYEDTQPEGGDLRFFGPEEGAAYPIEIERWDPAGRSFVWVRVDAPMLPDHLWMYYGDPEPFPAIDPPMVWDGAFAAVWHMERSAASTIPDITQTGHDLMPFNFIGDLEAEGKIGRAALIEMPPMPTEAGPFDLSGPELLSLSEAMTIEAWVAPSVAMDANTHTIVRKGSAYELRTLDPTSTRPTLVLRTAEVPGQHSVEAGASLSVDQWTYVAATYAANTGELAIYRDGQLEGTQTVAGEAMQRLIQPSGETAQVGHNLRGRLDEVRVSTVARSAAWIRLQYASMSDTLLTFGPPEQR